jgi:2-methylaconitate cis-trans-isomerase PrpF
VLTYNRPNSFDRLWASIEAAHAPRAARISIDIIVDFDAHTTRRKFMMTKLHAATSIHGSVSVRPAAINKGIRHTYMVRNQSN